MPLRCGGIYRVRCAGLLQVRRTEGDGSLDLGCVFGRGDGGTVRQTIEPDGAGCDPFVGRH